MTQHHAATPEHARILLARAGELRQLALHINHAHLSRDDILQEIHIRTTRLEDLGRLPAVTESLRSTPHCCLAGCGKLAEWEITSHRTNPTRAPRLTLACTEHVGDLLDDDGLAHVTPVTSDPHHTDQGPTKEDTP